MLSKLERKGNKLTSISGVFYQE
uniref:Uncharacterized protein n=1 Tax=Anguilla anguilla TaxID=7936 RepID=A0A0E9QVS2_ANGAN